MSGVVFYNRGTGCAVRLLVAAYSLRKYYAGDVTILSEGHESDGLCALIADALGATFKSWQCGVPGGTNEVYLAKTQYHLGTPHDVTVAIDADTLVCGDIDSLFDEAEAGEFCVAPLSDWRSNGRTISKRIKAWEPWLPDYIEPALRFGPAINCGVIAFRKDSALYRDWLKLALPGRGNFIPDETCCQVILHRYPHRIMDRKWNRSAKYDDPYAPDTRIIHFHGKKHCRPGLPFGGDLWMKTYQEVLALNVADIRSWTPAGDRMLKRYFRVAKPKACRKPKARSEPKRHEVRDLPSQVRRSLLEAVEVRLIVGAERTGQMGWISTDKPELDVCVESQWDRLLQGRKARAILAEHVWEHFWPADAETAARHCLRALEPGGYLRIAVPDAFHPNPQYLARVRPNGTGPQAQEHRVFYNHRTLRDLLTRVGFSVELMEYWDEEGRFHWRDWAWKDGYVSRSFRFDKRNRDGRPNYTSLMVDAFKPAEPPASPNAVEGIMHDCDRGSARLRVGV